VLGLAGVACAAPVMRVPKMKTPPTIDGTLAEDEWAGASAVSAFQNYYHRDLYPETMRTVWYLGYDDQNLYLAMYHRIPTQIVFKADCKTADFNDVEHTMIFGDHVEIEATPHSPARAIQQGFGFYKIVANVHGIFADTWYYNGLPGYESTWNSGCQLKSRFRKNEWWLEIAWPLSSMRRGDGAGNISKADGLELILQPVVAGSCGAYSFAGWQPCTWLEFDSFYRITLDPEAPAVQFLGEGDVVHGQLDAEFRTRASTPMSVAVRVSDADGKEVFRKTQSPAATRQGWQTAVFRAQDLPITYTDDGGKRNALAIEVKAGDRVLYTCDAAFAGHTRVFDDTIYGAYLRSRPKGDYVAQFAYYPCNGKARVKLDLDVIGDLPEAVQKAERLRLRIAPRQGGQDVFKGEFPIRDKTASELVDVGPLNGEYAAHIELLGPGHAAVSTRTVDFVRRKHEWEGNTIGEERVVIPPFRPLAYEGTTLKTRCAALAIGAGGLFDKVTVMGTDLLRGPMRITARAGGQALPWTGAVPQIERGKGRTFPPEYDQYSFMTKTCPRKKLEELAETDGYEARVSAEGDLGGLTTVVKARLEYDGHYLVNLTLDPKGAKVKLDECAIELDLWDRAGDLIILRNGGDPAYKLSGQDGIVWESGRYLARPIGFAGTFIPALSLSDGYHALQFRAISDQGWLLNDEQSCQVLERRGGKLTLRLRIVNAPAVLDRPRTLTFALIALPAKPPIPNWRHRVWDQSQYFHSAYGWRLYGTGADNWYLPTDEDYRILGDALRHPGNYTNRCPAWQGEKEHPSAQNGPILMYSSAGAVGAPLPDADSFKGQWYGDSAVTFESGDARVGKAWDLTGRFLYDKSECFTEAWPVSYDDDLVDNYLFYHRKLIELADTNGTMWDNAPIVWFTMLDTGAYGYVRDDGHVQPTCNIFMRRQLLKRLYTMGWMVGKPPFYFFKEFEEEPFFDMGWAIEGLAYIFSEHGTFFDQLPTDMTLFRTTWGGGRVPLRTDSDWARGPMWPMFAEKAYRSLFAVALLHDFALKPMDGWLWDSVLKRLDAAVGFRDPERQAEFLPYWDNADVVRLVRWTQKGGKIGFDYVQPEGVFVSVYRSRTAPRRALLWFVNATEHDINIGFWLDPQKLLGKSTLYACTGFDDGRKYDHHLPVSLFEPALAEGQELLTRLWSSVNVRARDYRALIVE
jgi:hypothetical protein